MNKLCSRRPHVQKSVQRGWDKQVLHIGVDAASPRDVVFERNVVYQVARMCYSWRERDINVVELSLKKMDLSDYQVESSLEFLQNLQVMAKTPARLCHLSRCAIRTLLRLSWNLPDGIYILPLPKGLQAYLNLKLD
ncbi:hypothetical protein LAZ67_14000252 [Cordylochernes scorpioides]|uniref:SOCS box domain-containing protein n=1 Tax=Cordylochernes scorpioides TaxID=51811 RepID=A0ABY6L5W6_9ARAC|nr:hypothetical protein LAZ67_14000252 [Cordylochernes scorpioides]